MTARERILVYVLGGLALGGVGYAAVTMFVQPIRAHNARIKELKESIENRQIELLTDQRNNQRLQALLPLTLPANRELAEAEYEAMLVRLFRDSKISGGKYAKQTSSLTDPEPELVPSAPGKPGKKAYAKVIYKIDFEKVTLAKLAAFVERYHKAPLLHQIVSCTVKHSASGPSALKQKAEERTDLTVTLISEAVLMDGAPERKTLYAVPDVFGAALGVPALYGLREDTEKARYLTPTPDPAYYALADIKREYDLIAARDAFHGPLPIPEVKIVDKGKEKIDEPPPPKPYDSSPFVYLNSLVQTSLGGTRTAQADIRDRYYEQYYAVRFTQFGNLFETKVERFTKELKTDPKTREVTSETKLDRLHPRTGSLMEISDRAGKEVRTFKVYGLYGNAILLGEKEKVVAPKEEKGKGGGGRPPQKGAKAPPVMLPKPDPRMVAIGGMGGIVQPKETFFVWEVGQSLKQARQLTDKEAKAALDVAAFGLKDQPSPKALEEAPKPRPVQVLTKLD